ncbi:MAG: DUF4296 domain-containing protein [Ignavibacteriaceae bacterium]|nr:DUF4296 domain-containing protein [Ignavibacteriaceae bacterium]
MRFRYSFLLLLFLSSFMGCTGRISEDKFISVYSDIVIAQDTTKTTNNLVQIKNVVFKRYNVTEKEYNATLNYYNSDPRKWEPFFNKAISRLEGLKSKKRS